MEEDKGSSWTAKPSLNPKKSNWQLIVVVLIILVGVIIGGFLYFKDKPVEEPVIDLSAEVTEDFEFNQEQYKTIINSIFASDDEGNVIVKADFIFEKLLKIEERVTGIETFLNSLATPVVEDL